MTHLSLSLLGSFRATLDGQPITGFRANKVRALLAYLAMEAGRPHARTALAGLLWPERPERAALDSLRTALATLRTAIGDRGATPPFLLITHETVQFNAASDCWLDVAAFRQGVESIHSSPSARERLEKAVDLYQGDFLQGFAVRGSHEYEDWMLLHRERLLRLASSAQRRLIDVYQASGELERACRIAWRQVELAPWEEEAHRGLMCLLALTGQRGAALAQYEACRRALAQELGVEPAEETVRLYGQIQAGEIELAAPPPNRERETPPGHPAFLKPQTGTNWRARSAFVAREPELAHLDGCLENVLSGQGQVVFVTGEAGTGKTALVGAFAHRAESRHASLIVATGNCNAYTGAGDPYLPFREILAQLTGDVEARWAAGTLSTLGARRLWRTMPLAIQSLIEICPGLIDAQAGDRMAGLISGSSLAARAAVAAPGGASWRKRLDRFLAVQGSGGRHSALRPADLHVQATALLQALAQHQPLLLILDDLQWADAGSIDLLFHLGRRLEGSRILIAGIYRPSEVYLEREGVRHPQRTSAFAAVVHEFERQFGSISVHLDQVGDRAFVEALLDSEPNRLGPEFREALYKHTQGHALCVVEMLRDMQECGALVQDEAGRWIEGASVDWAALPVRCESVIGERIDRLPAVLRETLAVASVEGETFTAEVVAQVRGIQAYRIVAQLSGELDRQHRLVANEGSRPLGSGSQRVSRYRFRHILLQEYAYNRLDEAERAYLHEAVANALEQLYAGHTETVAVQLAWHFSAATRMDKAADYALQAGDQARGLYAYAEARQHYSRALVALAQFPDTVETRGRRVETLIALAATSLRADSPERNLARLAEAERLAQELEDDEIPKGDSLRLAEVHFWMGFAHYLGGAYREGIRYYQQALSVARESRNDELTALCSASISQALGLQGRYGQAKPLAEQAIPLLAQVGHWSEWFRTQGHYGVVLAMMGDYAEGLAAIQRARAWAQERNAFTETVQSSFYLNAAYIQGGDLSRALAASRQVTELAERFGDRLYIYVGAFHQSWATSRAGQYDAAAAHAAKAGAMVQELGRPLVHVDLLAAVNAETAYGAGHVRQAVDLAERAVGIAQERGAIFAEGLARRAWGQALAALAPPQWDEAEAQLAHSLRLLEAGQARLEAARTHEAWGAVCRDRGDIAAARAHWEQAATQWKASRLDHELARTQALIESLASE